MERVDFAISHLQVRNTDRQIDIKTERSAKQRQAWSQSSNKEQSCTVVRNTSIVAVQ